MVRFAMPLTTFHLYDSWLLNQSLEAITFATLSLSNADTSQDSNDVSLPISESVIPQCFDCSANLDLAEHSDDQTQDAVKLEENSRADELILSELNDDVPQAYKVVSFHWLTVHHA
jgi:hypothetical protein